MKEFLDVAWMDLRGLLSFVAPTLLFSILASAIGSGVASFRLRLTSPKQLLRCIGYGVVIGTVIAILLSMLIEFAL